MSENYQDYDNSTENKDLLDGGGSIDRFVNICYYKNFMIQL